VIRVGLQAWVVDLRDATVRGEGSRQSQAVPILSRDPEGERLEPAIGSDTW
jgi:hypothetical protein